MATEGSITYGLLQQVHPEYDAGYWALCRAFYRGGKALLSNEALLNLCLPQNLGEDPQAYKIRKRLAHYVNHCGTILNHMVSKLFKSPLLVYPATGEDPVPKEFYGDVLKDGTRQNSLNSFLRQVMLVVLQCRFSWIQVDLPATSIGKNRAEQEQAGALRPYLLHVEPESIVDWKYGKDGGLDWVLQKFVSNERESVFSTRDIITETYWEYTRTSWRKWQIAYKKGSEIKETDLVPLVDAGEHSFGSVPVIRVEVPEGLWPMNKLESVCREYFNKRNVLAWAEQRALLPIPVVYVDPGEYGLEGHEHSEEGDRAIAQPRTIDSVFQLNAEEKKGDKFEWVGPPTDAFAVVAEGVRGLRDELFRVVNEMQLAADVEGHAIRRSGESKKEDVKPLEAVLGEYGDILRECAPRVLNLASRGIGKEQKYEASGVDEYETDSRDGAIESEAVLDTIEVPSPTYRRIVKSRFVRATVDADEEEQKAIDQELEDFYSQEQEIARKRHDEQEKENSRDS